MFGLSIHKSHSIERLRNEVVILREQAKELKQTGGIHESEIADLQQKFQMSKTDEDFDLESKRKIIVDKIKNFGFELLRSDPAPDNPCSFPHR